MKTGFPVYKTITNGDVVYYVEPTPKGDMLEAAYRPRTAGDWAMAFAVFAVVFWVCFRDVLKI